MNLIFSPSQKLILVITLFFISFYLVTLDSHPFIGCKPKTPESIQDSVAKWKYPSLSSIPDDEEGKSVKLGRSIFIETYKYIGPDVPDSNKRYLGTNMDCQNCHFNAGTQQYILGLVGTYSQYPALDARTNKVISIQERINECLTRSLNGRALPVNSTEMNSLVAYLKWLSTDVPKGKKVEGNGVQMLSLLNRAADTAKGHLVFSNNCTTCHAEDGSGVLNKPGDIVVPADSMKGYDFPPVMGMQSYNDGAGMYRLLLSASFIHAKMPLNRANLSMEDSYDVAAYINSVPRPNKGNLDKDYPDLKLKPVDFPFPPYADNFSQAQHKYGPYQEILKADDPRYKVDPNVGK